MEEVDNIAWWIILATVLGILVFLLMICLIIVYFCVSYKKEQHEHKRTLYKLSKKQKLVKNNSQRKSTDGKVGNGLKLIEDGFFMAGKSWQDSLDDTSTCLDGKSCVINSAPPHLVTNGPYQGIFQEQQNTASPISGQDSQINSDTITPTNVAQKHECNKGVTHISGSRRNLINNVVASQRRSQIHHSNKDVTSISGSEMHTNNSTIAPFGELHMYVSNNSMASPNAESRRHLSNDNLNHIQYKLKLPRMYDSSELV